MRTAHPRHSGVVGAHAEKSGSSVADGVDSLAGSQVGGGVQLRAARHCLKHHVPLTCAALLLSTASKSRTRDALQCLASVARLAVGVRHAYPKLLHSLERPFSSAAPRAAAHLSGGELPIAIALCELWALLPPSCAPPDGTIGALLSACRPCRVADAPIDDHEARDLPQDLPRGLSRGLSRDERVGPTAPLGGSSASVAWCAALLSLCCRPSDRPADRARGGAGVSADSIESLLWEAEQMSTASFAAMPVGMLAIQAGLGADLGREPHSHPVPDPNRHTRHARDRGGARSSLSREGFGGGRCSLRGRRSAPRPHRAPRRAAHPRPPPLCIGRRARRT